MALVTANGRPYEVASGISVADFVTARGLDPRYVVVERNGEPLPRTAAEGTPLADGDVLELVRAVAGGAAAASEGAVPEGAAEEAAPAQGPRDGVWRRTRLAHARLYLCVGALDAGEVLARFLDDVLVGGVDLVQLRDKEADIATLHAAAEVMAAAVRRHDALFIVNDDPVMALACGADGVHVGQDDASPEQARAVVGSERLVGLSTHTTDEFNAGLAEDCDYLCVGPVYETPTKAGRPAVGLGPVRHAAASASSRPWFVTGAMGPDTAQDVIDAGASRLVVVRALTEALDPGATARTLADLLAADR